MRDRCLDSHTFRNWRRGRTPAPDCSGCGRSCSGSWRKNSTAGTTIAASAALATRDKGQHAEQRCEPGRQAPPFEPFEHGDQRNRDHQRDCHGQEEFGARLEREGQTEQQTDRRRSGSAPASNRSRRGRRPPAPWCRRSGSSVGRSGTRGATMAAAPAQCRCHDWGLPRRFRSLPFRPFVAAFPRKVIPASVASMGENFTGHRRGHDLDPRDAVRTPTARVWAAKAGGAHAALPGPRAGRA